MKKRRLTLLCCRLALPVLLGGSAVWLILFITAFIMSKTTRHPYIFAQWGSSDAFTTLLLTAMGAAGTLRFFSACASNNVSNGVTANAALKTGAAVSVVFAVLDIIAVKVMMMPPEGCAAVNLWIEGVGDDHKGIVLSDYFRFTKGLGIFVFLHLFMIYLVFWLFGCMITRRYIFGKRVFAWYQAIGLMLFIICSSSLIMTIKGIEYENGMTIIAAMAVSSLLPVIVFTDIPALFWTIVLFGQSMTSNTSDAGDIAIISMFWLIADIVFFVIAYFITRFVTADIYTKKGKNKYVTEAKDERQN